MGRRGIIGRPELIEELASGQTWVAVAGALGFAEPASIRKRAVSLGVKRLRIRDVLVIECKA